MAKLTYFERNSHLFISVKLFFLLSLRHVYTLLLRDENGEMKKKLQLLYVSFII